MCCSMHVLCNRIECLPGESVRPHIIIKDTEQKQTTNIRYLIDAMCQLVCGMVEGIKLSDLGPGV